MKQWFYRIAVNEETYNAVQCLYNGKAIPYNRRRSTFYPFKAMILCSFCQRSMYVGPSKSQHGDNRYLNYRCDNQLCTRKKKSIRANIVLDFIYKLLAEGLHVTEEDDKKYYEGMTVITEEKRAQLEHERYSKQARLNSIDRDITNIALKLVGYDKDSVVYKVNDKKIQDLSGQKEDLEEQIAALK